MIITSASAAESSECSENSRPYRERFGSQPVVEGKEVRCDACSGLIASVGEDGRLIIKDPDTEKPLAYFDVLVGRITCGCGFDNLLWFESGSRAYPSCY